MKRHIEQVEDDYNVRKRQHKAEIEVPENLGEGRQNAGRNSHKVGNHGDQAEGPLCARCTRLENSDLFAWKGWGLHRIMELGSLDRIDRFTSCSACRLFDAVKIRRDHKPGEPNYTLCSLADRNTSFERVLAVVDLTGERNIQNSWQILRMTSRAKFITLATVPRDKAIKRLAPDRLVTPLISLPLLKSWTQSCMDLHQKECISQTVEAKPKNLRLIDCRTKMVLEARGISRYSALSYTWGKIISNGDWPIHGRLPDRLPQTIEDALGVSRGLDIPFIWIDRYCIDHEDENHKDSQIQQMDLVYKNAYLTIIAAVGDNPYNGLPGVSAPRETSQLHAWIGDTKFVSILPNPREYIQTSAWMKRGWTYQEGVFSCRRLIFTPQQIYWECRGAYAFESVNTFSAGAMPHLFPSLASNGQHPWEIFFHIGAYCGRELSYESDTLRAFEGVFNDFAAKKYPVYHYQGIPMLPLVVADGYGAVKRCERSRSESFAAGLCWHNKAAGVRRLQFPTWSWAGWNVPLSPWNPHMRYGLGLKNECNLTVLAEMVDGSFRAFDEHENCSEYRRSPAAFSSFIHIEGWTIPLQIQYMPKRTMEFIESEENFSGYFAIFDDGELQVNIPLSSLYQTYQDGGEYQSFVPNRSGGEIVGMVIGRCEEAANIDLGEDVFIMILQDTGQYFERVGHMLFNRLIYKWNPNQQEKIRASRRQQSCASGKGNDGECA